MKVGTDAILLGSSVTLVTGNALDIGCGTGILALMLAQRGPQLCNIVGIDINKTAVTLAMQNFSSSKWSDRLSAVFSSVQNYSLQKKEKYDLIIANPPFYSLGPLPKDKTKQLNKHNVRLSVEELLSATSNLLKREGRFSTIMPAAVYPQFTKKAAIAGLTLVRSIEVLSRPDRTAIRYVLEFIKGKNEEVEFDRVVLRGAVGPLYTKQYLRLTRDFYADISKM